MKLNNKGMSLMEILVTIALISLVVVFLFRLLIDLKDERNNNDFAYDNQINRAEAIYTIEQDLYTYSLIGVEDATSSNSGNIKLNFFYVTGTASGSANKTAVLDVSKTTNGGKNRYFINYESADGEHYSWEMKGAELDPCGKFLYNISNDNYYFKLNLFVYSNPYHARNNKESNNKVDDFELVFAGPKGNLNTAYPSTYNYLTNNTAGNKNIGTCTN